LRGEFGNEKFSFCLHHIFIVSFSSRVSKRGEFQSLNSVSDTPTLSSRVLVETVDNPNFVGYQESRDDLSIVSQVHTTQLWGQSNLVNFYIARNSQTPGSPFGLYLDQGDSRDLIYYKNPGLGEFSDFTPKVIDYGSSSEPAMFLLLSNNGEELVAFEAAAADQNISLKWILPLENAISAAALDAGQVGGTEASPTFEIEGLVIENILSADPSSTVVVECSEEQIINQAGSACLDLVQTCDITNGTGQASLNTSTLEYGACEVQSCDNGFIQEGGACVRDCADDEHLNSESGQCDANVIACTTAAGPEGQRTWDGSDYGAC